MPAGLGHRDRLFSALDVTFGFAAEGQPTYTAAMCKSMRRSPGSPLTAEEILARTREIEADEPPIIKAFCLRLPAEPRDPTARLSTSPTSGSRGFNGSCWPSCDPSEFDGRTPTGEVEPRRGSGESPDWPFSARSLGWVILTGFLVPPGGPMATKTATKLNRLEGFQ